MKLRLDKLLVGRGLVSSRERAQALILAGKVLVNEQKIEKSGAAIDEDSTIRLLGEDLKYVSRGGLKLERALEHWHIDVTGRTCLDVGASTGGFTDCLLQHGAARVLAVDTGYGQLDLRLRNDPRVRLLERTNARYLTHEMLGEFATFIAMDVSFISATLVLPAVIASAFPSRTQEIATTAPKANTSPDPAHALVILVKPQFEAGRAEVGKGGIVRNQAAQLAALERVRQCALAQGAHSADAIDSPILGSEGNREFLLYAKF
jgi:23S rRNA (cytidine1920-2'-O)/16S rRNA (cytidine1409-2'-O)-methyltransferase